MILKGSQRAGAKQLAVHLLRADENEHVEVHELRGFMASDLAGALREAAAISRGTKCKQFMFSLSLSPPETEKVPIAIFEKALNEIEERLGLSGQPRAVVFHEKQGRRHAHCVWSRIDTEAMRAINLSHFKRKLTDMSRKLYLEHGWRMPNGLANKAEKDPANFSLAEWQQAKRTEQDAKVLKTVFQECWAISDSRRAFAQALSARGFHLAQGDRRGFVALDYRGESYAIAKWVGLRTKEIKAKLGTHDGLPSIAEAKALIADKITDALKRHVGEVKREFRARWTPLEEKRSRLTNAHRAARDTLRADQEARWIGETLHRSRRLSRGLRGIWDRITGRAWRINRQNEQEALVAMQRDRDERDAMIETHLEERRQLQTEIRQVRRMHARETARLHRGIAAYQQWSQWEINAEPEDNATRRRQRHGPSL